MAVNRFSPGCECCDTGCTRMADGATSGSISSVWDNTAGGWQAASDGYENTSTSGTLWTTRPMNTSDNKGSFKFQFETLEVGATLTIYFDYVDSNNHHYLTVSRTTDEACEYTEQSLTKIYDFVIGKVDAGVASSIASRTGVRGNSPEYEFVCVEWDSTHVIVYTTLLIAPTWAASEVGWWNCEPSGFGLTSEYTPADGDSYGIGHNESSAAVVKVNNFVAIKSREEENCPGCYLDCPCNVVPEEFDITISGIKNPERRFETCSNCDNLNDTYTLTLQEDNFEKFPYGVDGWVKTRGKPANYFGTTDPVTGNCVYMYTAEGHSSPPSASCSTSETVYVKRVILWFTGAMAHVQICLSTSTEFGTADIHVWNDAPITLLQLVCASGAGARFELPMSQVSGTRYRDCMINASGIEPITYANSNYHADLWRREYNSGRTCELSGIQIEVVGS